MDGVTLDRLFRVSKEVELPGNIKVKVRALSDAELQTRNRSALRARFEAEKRLKDPESTEYIITLLPLEDADADAYRATLLAYRRSEVAGEAERELPLVYVPFPDNADDAERVVVLGQREESEKAIRQKRAELAEKWLANYAKTLTDMDEEALRKQCRQKTAEFFGRTEFFNEFMAHTIYLCTETLDGQRYFASVEEAKGVPLVVTNRIAEIVAEVNDLDPFLSKPSSATA